MTAALLDASPPALEPAEAPLPPAPSEQRGSVFRRVLQDRSALLSEVIAGEEIPIGKLLLASALLTSLAGVALGASNGLAQSLSAGVKTPLLAGGALLVTFPAFYVFALLQGSRLGIGQAARLFSVGVGLRSAILAGLAPVLFFFSCVGSPYGFLLLLGLGVFGVGEAALLRTVREGAAKLREAGDPIGRGLLLGWSALYLLVVAQLTWSLRPLIGNPGVFAEQGWHAFGGPGGNMLTYFAQQVLGALG